LMTDHKTFSWSPRRSEPESSHNMRPAVDNPEPVVNRFSMRIGRFYPQLAHGLFRTSAQYVVARKFPIPDL
ncbi:MAG: hypothetical protein ACQETK_13185, partial [Pseudomonadota bacterium]